MDREEWRAIVNGRAAAVEEASRREELEKKSSLRVYASIKSHLQLERYIDDRACPRAAQPLARLRSNTTPRSCQCLRVVPGIDK
jgi:hypothetical protein